MPQPTFDFSPARRVYSVSDLNAEVRELIENRFPDVWVSGEVSNCRVAGSGHYYFTLKDESSQVRAVCFRNQALYLKTKPKDGMQVVARGRLSVYSARGEYQLYVEFLELAGEGALQLAFEQLKQKLAAEGLFDPARKKALPPLPRKIGVVTSPTGAVVQDIIRVLQRRYPNIDISIFPAKVQGEGAAQEIVRGIEHFNQQGSADILIVARGGGSIEDLWAFNEEIVARAIFASAIPIISAVGHETDFTIADFVADLRAPTPSAAAELAVQPKQDLADEIRGYARHLSQSIRLKFSEFRQVLSDLRLHRVFQTLSTRLAERSQRVDENAGKLDREIRGLLHASRQHWLHASAGVIRFDFMQYLRLKRAGLDERERRFGGELQRFLKERRTRLTQLQTILMERSPQALLDRGYSVTRDQDGRIIRDASRVTVGAEISVRLAKGFLGAEVNKVG